MSNYTFKSSLSNLPSKSIFSIDSFNDVFKYSIDAANTEQLTSAGLVSLPDSLNSSSESNTVFVIEKTSDGDIFTNWISQEQYETKLNFEKQAFRIRVLRDKLLRDSDWTQMKDVNKSNEWLTYRQALRDVPGQEGFPYTVSWPVKPN